MPISPSASASASWPHPDYEPKLVLSESDQTWRVSVRRRNSGESFTSLEPNRPGYPTPEAALAAASAGLTSLLVNREEVTAIETVRFLSSGRLRSVDTQEPGPAGGNVTVTRWQARDDAGKWVNPSSTPQEAVRAAKSSGPAIPVATEVVGSQAPSLPELSSPPESSGSPVSSLSSGSR